MDSGNAIFGRPSYQGKATHHVLAINDVLVAAPVGAGALRFENPEIVATDRGGFRFTGTNFCLSKGILRGKQSVILSG